jgi:hypothetical protein
MNMKSFTSMLLGAAASDTAHIAIAAAISGKLYALNFISVPQVMGAKQGWSR